MPTKEPPAAPKRQLTLRLLGPGHLPEVRDIVLGAAKNPIVVTVSVGATLYGKIGPPEFLAQMHEMAGDNRHARKTKPGLKLTRGKPGVDLESFPAVRYAAFALAADGSFEITGIGTGSWSVGLWWQKARSSTKSSSTHLPLGEIRGLREGERHRFDADLSDRMFAKLAGKIRINGKPHKGQVVLYRDGKWSGSATADANGDFVGFFAPGSYRVRARGLIATQPVVLAPGQKASGEFHVEAVTARLRVLGPDGKPRHGVRLSATAAGGALTWPFSSSDQNGHCEGQLSPGTYELQVLPKTLNGSAALRKFYAAHRDDAGALERARLPVLQLAARLGHEDRIDVPLPKQAGY